MYKRFTINELIGFTKTLKVLFVEDNQEAREALLDLLNNFFDEIIVAVDGEEGFKKFQAEPFDLVISDIRMPNADGIEMSKNIRSMDCTVPIIITTAHKESDLLLKSIEVGISAYLLKPINFKNLEKVIKQTCEKIYYFKRTQEYEHSLEQLVKERTQELELTKNRLQEMAHKDPMTNLYNRRYLHDISKTLFNISQREKKAFSILMIDIDRFKSINDQYGHMIGDSVIQLLADIFRDLIRASDIAIRFGGEEFIILLPNTEEEGAYEIASKIKNRVQNQRTIVGFTVSIGVSKCNFSENTDINKLLHKVDEALYKAKRDGRNRVVIYKSKEV
jgi:diguanylate cyclase (GGDEF)-like protein